MLLNSKFMRQGHRYNLYAYKKFVTDSLKLRKSNALEALKPSLKVKFDSENFHTLSIIFNRLTKNDT